jgi:hypothetical protein
MARSESTEWLDMLGNSFLYGVARFSVPGLSWDTRRRGLHVRATRRCKVSTTHLLPLMAMLALLLLERRREAFTGGCCRR